MLRITRETKDGTVWLRLEGKLVGPWVDECRSACAQETANGRRMALDLSQVTFVDRAGVHLLHQLAESGVELPLCTSFVAELLRLEESQCKRL
ncbi:MAG: STAS domain-containing protein [Phycisphaerae bacterium]|nr:STAS domain-containing protein [Phycisphaerae bacterium]